MSIKITENTLEAADQHTAKVSHFSSSGHEQISYFHHQPTGLRAIIAIHSTTLGPSIGGLRCLTYADEQAALKDVLRLSEGMTHKLAIAGLDMGGAKAVIMQQGAGSLSPSMLRKFGQCVEQLNGQYITAPDVNTNIHHMVEIAHSTRHVACLPTTLGGEGDPSENTAYGLYISMKAAAHKVFGSESLTGKKIGVQGVGKVGGLLLKWLSAEGAILYATDVYPETLKAVSCKYSINVVHPEDIYSLPLDIYSPCALGATLNKANIAKLNCAIVAGGANNQLQHPSQDSKLLMEKGIVYLPDFLVNAGGVIQASSERMQGGFNPIWVKDKTENIYQICLKLLEQSAKTGKTTDSIAKELSIKRIQEMQKLYTR